MCPHHATLLSETESLQLNKEINQHNACFEAPWFALPCTVFAFSQEAERVTTSQHCLWHKALPALQLTKIDEPFLQSHKPQFHPVTSPEPAVSQHNLSAEARLTHGSGADKACPWVSQEAFRPYYCRPFSHPMPPEMLRLTLPRSPSQDKPRSRHKSAQNQVIFQRLYTNLVPQVFLGPPEKFSSIWEENTSAVNWHVRARTWLAKLFSLGSWPNPSHVVTSRLPKVSQKR